MHGMVFGSFDLGKKINCYIQFNWQLQMQVVSFVLDCMYCGVRVRVCVCVCVCVRAFSCERAIA